MAAAINGAYESHFIANDGHPNERTNRLAADLTWPWLKPRLESLIKQ
jgi:hypothetical protein